MLEDYFTQLDIKEDINKTKIKTGLFKFIKGFEVVLLKRGSRIVLESKDSEVGVVILKGKCNISIGGKTYENLGSRENIFEERPTAIYIPAEERFEIFSHGVELAICYAGCNKKSNFVIVSPEEVKVMQIGKDNWKRQVSLIISPDTCSVNLIIGETINPPGNWSGTPAHKHEVDNPPIESLHEELYYFRCNRDNGFGIQRFYSAERKINELVYLRENIVTFMPFGYHQIVAGPGYTLYYLFFLSGPANKLIGFSDPMHKWLNEEDKK